MNYVADEKLHRVVEAFLFREAELLDDWHLPEWEALLTDDAVYRVPPIGVDNAESLSPENTMFVMFDDRIALAARVERLMGRMAWAEKPRSRIRHMISNVRVLEDDGQTIKVTSNFTVYRVRRREITPYIGKYVHALVRAEDGFRIRDKTVVLDMDVLRGQGGVSFLL